MNSPSPSPKKVVEERHQSPPPQQQPIPQQQPFISQDIDDPTEEILAMEEAILNRHVECVKEDAQLLTEEGELITRLQTAMTNEQDYDMKHYITQVENIAKKKIEMFSSVLNLINDAKQMNIMGLGES